jgi:predicted ester cyclase
MTHELGAAHQRLGHEPARTLFERNFRFLNEHDVRHIPTIFAEDIELRDDAWPEIMNGHSAVERFLTALWRALPDFRFELVEGPFLAADGHRAAARVRVAGTVTGPYDPPGFAPTHRRLTTEFGGFYEFEGERVRRARIIVNMNDVAIQIGAAPRPGTPAERLAVAMQRLNARRIARRSNA